MFIKLLTIKNFRSIKDITINPNNLCALIGPNSVGKTNVLKAIDLIIGEGWTTKARVAREFFNNVTQPVIIEIEFTLPIEFVNKRGYQVSVSSIKLEMNIEPELSVKTTINGGDTFYDQDQFKKICHFILIPSERQLASELRVSQWTMLGKLMRLVYENYITQYGGNETELKNNFAEKIKPAKEFLEDDFSEDEITFKKFVTTFKRYCKENSAGLANEFEPVLDIYNLNWFYKTLQIHVKENYPDRHLDCEEIGAGMQNLLLVSIFQTYADLMGGKVIFGIEEPEIYLHPQAQRSLYDNFIKISGNTQIFYTTHNPNFVNAARPDDITLLRKKLELGTHKLEKDPFFNDKNAKKIKHQIYTHFNPERNELFFAKKVILVEGASDKILFSTLCDQKWGINLNAMGISIIECGGKAGVSYFIGVCELIGLNDYYAIWDKDGDIDNNKLLSDALSANKGLELSPNLEGVLKLSNKVGENKVKNAYDWASNESNEIPKLFLPVENFLREEDAQPIIAEESSDEAENEEAAVFDIRNIPF